MKRLGLRRSCASEFCTGKGSVFIIDKFMISCNCFLCLGSGVGGSLGWLRTEWVGRAVRLIVAFRFCANCADKISDFICHGAEPFAHICALKGSKNRVR